MRLSVFTKLFIVFLLIISPLYLLVFYLHAAGYNQLKQEIYTSTLNNTDLYISNLENELRKTIYSSVQLINSQDIHEIALLDEIPADLEVFYGFTRIQRQLAWLRESLNYIEDAYVLFPLSGAKVTYRSRQQMTEADYARINDNTFYSGFPFINYAPDDGLYVNFSSEYHLPAPPPEQVRWLIVTKIDVAKIKKELDSYFIGPYDQNAFIGEVNGFNMTGHLEGGILSEIGEQVYSLTGNKGIVTMSLQSANILVAYRRSAFLRSSFVLFTREQQLLSTLNDYRNWIWIITGIMVILLVIFTILTRRVVAIPMNRLIYAVKQGITGDLDNNIAYNAKEEFGYIYKQFNEMLLVHRQAINQLYEQDLLLKDTELKMLQYQINPHFLYNTFFTMYQLSQAEEYMGLQEMLLHIGNYFNFITKSEGFIPLSDEISFCVDYIGIQTIRFSNRITVEVESLPVEHAALLIPRITLQPLLENCYKHGLVNKELGGLICLRYIVNGPLLIICVEDNGDELTENDLRRIQKGLEEDKDSSTLGIRNVHKRLCAHFGEGYGIKVSRSALGGLLAEVYLPVGETKNV